MHSIDWTSSTVNLEDYFGGASGMFSMTPWGQNRLSDGTSGVTECSTAWRWKVGQAEVGHFVIYRSPSPWVGAELETQKTRVFCQVLLDILPEDSVRTIFDLVQQECSRYAFVDPITGFLTDALFDDPYANGDSSRRMAVKATALFNSVLRARPTDPDERNR